MDSVRCVKDFGDSLAGDEARMLEVAKKKILGGKRKFSGLRYEVGCATGVLMLNQISGLENVFAQTCTRGRPYGQPGS